MNKPKTQGQPQGKEENYEKAAEPEEHGGWYIDEENACVRDELNAHEGVDSIVWEYTGEAEYKA